MIRPDPWSDQTHSQSDRTDTDFIGPELTSSTSSGVINSDWAKPEPSRAATQTQDDPEPCQHELTQWTIDELTQWQSNSGRVNQQHHSLDSEPVSGPSGFRFEFSLKLWIRNWVLEPLSKFWSFRATDPTSAQLCLEQLIAINAFSSVFGYSITSPHIIDFSHTYCGFVVIVSVVAVVSCLILLSACILYF